MNLLKKEKTYAIILSAGKGKRMKSDISKQYMEINNKPVIYYALSAFQKSDVDEIILVVGKEDVSYVKKEIVDKYKIEKVTKIVTGGRERYDSVINGLACIGKEGKVLIHDGARPLIKVEQINRIIENVNECGACVAGVPTKDTVKIINKDNVVERTPERKYVWQIQTPQAFDVSIIRDAYNKMKIAKDTSITDDSMAVEKYTNTLIRVIDTGYENIKITTPEDLIFAKELLVKK